MNIKILSSAEHDLINGHRFYEAQESGLGNYFLDTLYSDIDSLRLFAGIHQLVHSDFYRMLSKRFPFAIYYSVETLLQLFMRFLIVAEALPGCVFVSSPHFIDSADW